MKKIKYRIGDKEDISIIPYGSVIDVYFVIGNKEEGIIYIPKKVKWSCKNEHGIDEGCGCLIFARLDHDKVWKKHHDDYINLDYDDNQFEKRINKKKRKI